MKRYGIIKVTRVQPLMKPTLTFTSLCTKIK